MSLNSNTINNFATTIKKGSRCSKIDMISSPPLDGGMMEAEPPLDDGWMTDEPPLDGGRMAVEMSVGLIKYISYSPPLDGGRMEAEVTVGVVK